MGRYRLFEDSFRRAQDVAGAFYLWIVGACSGTTSSSRGACVVGGERVELFPITCPLHLLGGATDHIAPPEQVFAAADVRGTPADDVSCGTTRVATSGCSSAPRRAGLLAGTSSPTSAAQPRIGPGCAEVRETVPQHQPS